MSDAFDVGSFALGLLAGVGLGLLALLMRGPR